jgi:acyl carrier protein
MNKETNDQVIKALSDYLGVDPEDIKEEDSIYQDLHMQASDLSDFMETLQTLNIETGNIDLTEIETVEDLIDALGGEKSSE